VLHNLEEKAAQGDAVAQQELGDRSFNGDGFEQNYQPNLP